MPDSTKPLVGEVLGPKSAGIAGAFDGFNALNSLVEAANACVRVHATEKTKQARIGAYEATEVHRIKAAEGILRQYFDAVFDERRATIDGFFERLDIALEKGDSEVINDVVRSVVDIAKSSPLADLGDLSQIRAALDDPDQVWEL